MANDGRGPRERAAETAQPGNLGASQGLGPEPKAAQTGSTLVSGVSGWWEGRIPAPRGLGAGTQDKSSGWAPSHYADESRPGSTQAFG